MKRLLYYLVFVQPAAEPCIPPSTLVPFDQFQGLGRGNMAVDVFSLKEITSPLLHRIRDAEQKRKEEPGGLWLRLAGLPPPARSVRRRAEREKRDYLRNSRQFDSLARSRHRRGEIGPRRGK